MFIRPCSKNPVTFSQFIARTQPAFEWKELIFYVRVNQEPIPALQGPVSVNEDDILGPGIHVRKGPKGYFFSGFEVRDEKIQQRFSAIITNSRGLMGGGVANSPKWKGINDEYISQICTETLEGFGTRWFWDVII